MIAGAGSTKGFHWVKYVDQNPSETKEVFIRSNPSNEGRLSVCDALESDSDWAQLVLQK